MKCVANEERKAKKKTNGAKGEEEGRNKSCSEMIGKKKLDENKNRAEHSHNYTNR